MDSAILDLPFGTFFFVKVTYPQYWTSAAGKKFFRKYCPILYELNKIQSSKGKNKTIPDTRMHMLCHNNEQILKQQNKNKNKNKNKLSLSLTFLNTHNIIICSLFLIVSHKSHKNKSNCNIQTSGHNNPKKKRNESRN